VYLAGFALEKSLSIDNVFVFAVLLATLGVPERMHSRVLAFGIVGALAMRGTFIALGAALLDAFHAAIYLFGALLLASAWRILRHTGNESAGLGTGLQRLLSRLAPRTRRASAVTLTALIAVAAADVMFAIDSIPAIFAITTNTYIVLAANAFSVLGLRPMYFVLRSMTDRFAHLSTALGVLLGYVGLKMLLSGVVQIPPGIFLLVIAAVLCGGVALSLRTRPGDRPQRSRHIGQPSTRDGAADPDVGDVRLDGGTLHRRDRSQHRPQDRASSAGGC
jgi:tellurite resistance protein TerC